MSKQIPKSKFQILFLLAVILSPLNVNANSFDPNILITDERFVDTGTLGGVEGIQRFLENKASVLANTSADFLLRLREPGDTSLKAKLPDPRPNLGRLRTAAELIADAATASGLNGQVILVTLQKEQSLITGQFPEERGLQKALDRALGFGCPDEGGCSEIFLGFYHQLFGNFDAQGNRYIGMPWSLIRSFNYEVGGARVGRGPMIDASGNAFGNGNRIRTSRKGDIITLENTQPSSYGAPPTQTVTLSNFATAALYRYTPHIYNGNYNFVRFFTSWFKYPNGTLITVAGDAKTYVIDNGLKRPISSFVIGQRGLNPAGVVAVSVLEFTEFALGEVMPPHEGTIFRNSSGAIFLIEQESRKSISSFVAKQRKLDLPGAVLLPDEEILSFKDGGKALPVEGTLVKAKDNPAVYLITSGEKRLLSEFVFKQRGLKFSDVLTADEPGELDSYSTGKLMPPLDGTLIKAKEEPAVYHVGNGLLEPLALFVFQAHKFSFTKVISVPKAEVAGWDIGKSMPPPTGLLVKSRDEPVVYYMEAGVRRAVSYAVFLKNNWNFKDVIVVSGPTLQIFELGEPLPLPERSLAKTRDDPTVYYLVDGVWRPLTFKAFQNRRLLFEHVITVSEEQLNKFPIGAVVEN